MSNRKPRVFAALDPYTILRPQPLFIGLYGFQGRGKSHSAVRLAIGVSRLYGYPVRYVDTENRGVEVAQKYDVEYVPFPAPHNAEDFIDLFRWLSETPSVVVIDQMSEEHEGERGLLETFDDAQGGNQKKNAQAWGVAKGPHKRLAREMRRFIETHPLLCCWRAQEKVDWNRKDANGRATPTSKGAMPIGSPDLPFECTATYLLGNMGDRGVPLLDPEGEGECLMTKIPAQFVGLIRKGEQLSEAHGDAFARWSLGVDLVIGQLQRAQSAEELKKIGAQIRARWPDERHPARLAVSKAAKAAAARVGAAPVSPEPPPAPAAPAEPHTRQPGED